MAVSLHVPIYRGHFRDLSKLQKLVWQHLLLSPHKKILFDRCNSKGWFTLCCVVTNQWWNCLSTNSVNNHWTTYPSGQLGGTMLRPPCLAMIWSMLGNVNKLSRFEITPGSFLYPDCSHSSCLNCLAYGYFFSSEIYCCRQTYLHLSSSGAAPSFMNRICWSSPNWNTFLQSGPPFTMTYILSYSG